MKIKLDIHIANKVNKTQHHTFYKHNPLEEIITLYLNNIFDNIYFI